MSNHTIFTKQLAAASATNIALLQTPGSAALTLNGSTVAGGVATIDAASSANLENGRRVIITSGGNDTGINWTVVGTNSSGSVITDTFAGASGGAAQSNLDFVTVTSITPSGAVASTALAGTNGVGSSRWYTWNYKITPPMNLSFAVEVVSGSVNYTVQYTYDNPNPSMTSTGITTSNPAFPLAFNTILLSQTTTADATLSTPVIATRVLINSGTGEVRCRYTQAGIG